MNDRLTALRVFVRTAYLGSLSRAAQELGLSQPSASRILATLERDIGAVLLQRTTRAMTLTEAGIDYLARVEPLLAALEEADRAVPASCAASCASPCRRASACARSFHACRHFLTAIRV